jgi:hypothetical protein
MTFCQKTTTSSKYVRFAGAAKHTYLEEVVVLSKNLLLSPL